MVERFLNGEDGQGMTEYILLVFLIAVACYFGFQMYGGKLGKAFERGKDEIARAK